MNMEFLAVLAVLSKYYIGRQLAESSQKKSVSFLLVCPRQTCDIIIEWHFISESVSVYHSRHLTSIVYHSLESERQVHFLTKSPFVGKKQQKVNTVNVKMLSLKCKRFFLLLKHFGFHSEPIEIFWWVLYKNIALIRDHKTPHLHILSAWIEIAN